MNLTNEEIENLTNLVNRRGEILQGIVIKVNNKVNQSSEPNAISN